MIENKRETTAFLSFLKFSRVFTRLNKSAIPSQYSSNRYVSHPPPPPKHRVQDSCQRCHKRIDSFSATRVCPPAIDIILLSASEPNTGALCSVVSLLRWSTANAPLLRLNFFKSKTLHAIISAHKRHRPHEICTPSICDHTPRLGGLNVRRSQFLSGAACTVTEAARRMSSSTAEEEESPAEEA